jgi:hypothetical protein
MKSARKNTPNPSSTNWFTVVTASRQSLFSGKKATDPTGVLRTPALAGDAREVATTKLGNYDDPE